MAKFIFVTGGVVSGLGKGITAASLGRLLKCRGLKVASQKLDPYVNVDPGTMSPLQHGEVFVTDDGTETDLDLGHYERFIDENLNKYSNLTTGKVYWNVLNKDTELAKDAIDYTLYPDYRTHYKAHTNATVELAACKYFTTNLLDVDTIMVRDFSELDSFVVYICMEGKASIRDNKGNEIYIHQGQTVLIPADTDVVTISPVPGAKFMETYIG